MLMKSDELEVLKHIAKAGQAPADARALVTELLQRELITPTSDNPPVYAVTGKGLAFLATYGLDVSGINHVRCRVERPSRPLYGNRYADKRAGQ